MHFMYKVIGFEKRKEINYIDIIFNFCLLTIYIKISLIMTIAIWWSSHDVFRLSKKLLFKFAKISSLT